MKKYNFVSVWNVESTAERVYEIISKPEDFIHWWSDVYLEVEEIKRGNEAGAGRILRVLTKGKLPYTLNWRAEVLEAEKPRRILLRAEGDLEGTGEWQFVQNSKFVEITYNWTVITNRRWMNLLSPVLKKLFESNHRWAMKKGEQGLKQKLVEDINH